MTEPRSQLPQENEISNTNNDRNKPKQKKKFDPIDYYQAGTFLDAKDSIQSWCTATIVERCDSDNTLKINFDGWSHRWDEWVRFSSSKIAPFRRYSMGNQTFTQFENLRIYWSDKVCNKGLEVLPARIGQSIFKTSRLKEIMDSNFSCITSAYEITQFFRGEEFVFIDCLLQNEYSNPQEEVPQVLNYFKVFFDMYIKFLRVLPDYLPDFIEGLVYPDSFYTNERIALSNCVIELTDAVGKIFGRYERLLTHFGVYDSKKYDFKVCVSTKYAGKDIKTVYMGDKDEDSESSATSGHRFSKLITQLINLFGELGGWEAWLNLFTYILEDPKDINNSILPPYKMLRYLIEIPIITYHYLNKDFQATLMLRIRETVQRRLKILSDKEIKELDREFLTHFLHKAQHLLINYFDEGEIFKITELAELEISLRFLTCPFFEKRLKGINEIKELTEKIDVHEYFLKFPNHYTHAYSEKRTRFLNAKNFINWLFQNKIFDLILGDSMHLEIIKRTHDILKFIAKYETIPTQLIDLLWKSCEGKHEAVLIGLYDLIIQISEHLDPEGIKQLKKKIESIKDEDQNEMTLNLIKGFATNTLPKLNDLEEQTVDESRYHCLDVLWRLMQDESQISTQLSESALNSLGTILKEKACQPLRFVYLCKCLDNIVQRKSVAQSINLVHSILGNYYQHRFESENSLSSVLDKLEEKYKILQLLVEEFHDYMNRMKAFISKLPHEPTSEDREKVYIGKYSHQINFTNRLIFIEYLNTSNAYEVKLGVGGLDRLWECLITGSIWEADKDYFYAWISRKQEAGRTYDPTPIVQREDLPEFFKQVLSNPKKLDFIELSPEGFECFTYFFKNLNDDLHKFRIVSATKFQVNDLSYEGKDTLWIIFLNCRNEKTIPFISHLIVECNLRLAPTLEDKKREIWENFVTKCINLLKDGYSKQNERLISKALLVLKNFFDRYEGKARTDIKREDLSKIHHATSATVLLKPDNVSKTFMISGSTNVGVLRKKIADHFNLGLHDFKLFARGEPVDPEDDECPIQQFSIAGNFLAQRIESKKGQNPGGEYHPKKIIAENSEYVDLLFTLLSSDTSAVNDIWELLVRLPVNQKIKDSLYQINGKWEDLLDTKSTHLYRLLYCVQIIEKFLLDPTKERLLPLDLGEDCHPTPFLDREWAVKFVESGGLKILVKILDHKEFKCLKSYISVKTLGSILKIISHFLTTYTWQNLFEKDSTELAKKMVNKLVSAIHAIAEYSIAREAKETEHDKANYAQISLPAKMGEDNRVPEPYYFEAEALHYSQSLIQYFLKEDFNHMQTLYSYQDLQRLLAVGLIESDNSHLKEKVSNFMLRIILTSQTKKIKPLPHQFFIPIFLQSTLKSALLHQERSDTFFKLLTSTVNAIDLSQVDLDIDDLLKRLVSFVKERKPVEKTQKDSDTVLNGILQLLRVLFNRYPNKSQKYGQDEKLVLELLGSCLFEIPRRPDKKLIPGPKCKSHSTRFSAFKLLMELARGHNDNLREVINFIGPMHRNGKWRTKRYVDWNITPKENEKSSTGYVGLRNLGCICYMNSTIQQLYMIPTFRKAVLDVEDRFLNSTPKEDNILYQLKCIFLALNESEKQYFNPKGFCQSFKDWDGNPTNVYEQMDADEFLNMFMDRLENLIKGTKQELFIKKHLGGVMSNELICKGCPHYAEREEAFLTVSLQVKNKKSIYQSLASFVEGEMLEGDNAYYCEECKKKVNTLKRVCLKKLPNHLILVLKRFEFDYDTMQKVKVNDYCEFPFKLNMEPYTQQGLRKVEKAKKGENSEGSSSEPSTKEEEQPTDYFEYKLTGVVIHLGSADSGHYYSLIQDQELLDIPEDKRWYEFNDTFVSKFDPKDIPSEAYGGEEKWKYYSEMMSGKEKIKNAYLLFYERIKHYDEPEAQKAQPMEPEKKKSEESKEEKEDAKKSKGDIKGSPGDDKKKDKFDEQCKVEVKDEGGNIPQDFLQQIIEKNQVFHMRKYVFSKEYFDFVIESLINRDFTPNLIYNENYHIDPVKNPKEYYDLELLKLGILFFLTAVLRDRVRSGIIKFLPFLKKTLSQNVCACFWLLEQFSCKKIIFEYLLDCPVGDMRRFIVGLLSVAITVSYEFEGKGARNRLFEEDPKTKLPVTYLGNFINACINVIFESRHNNREYTEYYKVFCELGSCGPEVVGYMVHKKTIGRFLDFFFDMASPLNDHFRDMTDVPFKEPTDVELGTPQEEKVKIRSAWEELILKRKDRIVESHSAQKTYFWKALCIMVMHCKANGTNNLGTKNPWQIGDNDDDFTQNDRTLLTPEAKFIEKAVSDAPTKMGYRYIAKMYSYLCYEDIRVTTTFISAIKNGLLNSEANSFKPFFRCFTTLLEVNDSLTEYRVQELGETLLKVLKENNTFFVEMDAFTNFFLKALMKSQKFNEWAIKSKENWDWILEWIGNNMTPPVGITSSGSVRLQKKRAMMSISHMKYDSQEYKARSSLKLKKFKKLIEGEKEEFIWDSDEDLGDHNFVLGEKVDLDPHNHSKWCTGEVDTVLEEMVNIAFSAGEEQNSTWLSRDSENIAPHNTMKRMQAEVNQEISNLLKSHDTWNQDEDSDNSPIYGFQIHHNNEGKAMYDSDQQLNRVQILQQH